MTDTPTLSNLLADVNLVRDQLEPYKADLVRWYQYSDDACTTEQTTEAQGTKQDAFITSVLGAKQRQMETDLRIRYATQVVKCNAPDVETPYDILDDPYDYIRDDYKSFGYFTLRHRPILSVNRVRLMFGPGEQILEYPSQWIRCNRSMGQLQIVPMPGAVFSNMFMAPFLLPQVGGRWQYDNIPATVYIDYTTGVITEDMSAYEWTEHQYMLTKLAVREVLVQLSDMKYAGLSGISVEEDGLSQNYQFTRGGMMRYGPAIQLIDGDYDRFVKQHQHFDSPIVFTVI